MSEDGIKATTRIPEDLSSEVLSLKQVEVMNCRLKSKRDEALTKTLAERFITMETFIGERRLNDEHLEFLVRKAKTGRFLNHNVVLASCYCEWDKKERRLNGQHVCWMRTYMPADWNPTVNVQCYTASTEDDFRSLYACFDRGKSRSNAQVVIAETFGTSGFFNLNKRDLSGLASALRLFTCDTSTDNRNVDEIVELMKGKYHKLTLEVANFLAYVTTNNASHMHKRAPVAAAMYATFSRSVQHSNEFWTKVRDGGGGANEPSQMLMKYLMKTDIKANFLKARDTVPREDMYRVCISCWNAYRQGYTLKALRVTEKRVAAK